jgi:ubiquinone/menaquinone biosynthesis C-methylase UbiE
VSETTRHDAWQAADSYDAYMGRWSRQLAPRFLEWLDPPDELEWLEVGCGTGALSSAIVNLCRPKSLISIDPSESFLAKARQNVGSELVEFRTGDAQSVSLKNASRDVAVSGLVLNFVPDRAGALAEMKRVTRPGGVVAYYVWDYPGGGLEFLRAFWNAAAALDPSAENLKEDRRFPYCTPEGLTSLSKAAGLANVEWTSIDIPTVFRDFEDYWRPFTFGAGPAPGYCTSLKAEDQERLKSKLCSTLHFAQDGSIPLKARAWAIRGIV